MASTPSPTVAVKTSAGSSAAPRPPGEPGTVWCPLSPAIPGQTAPSQAPGLDLPPAPFPRYLGRPKAEQTVLVRPPFLRPEVSDGQITVKIMDNGIQTELKRTKVRKVGISAPCVGALHGAQGCKPASVSKEPSEPCHVPHLPPCRLVLCPHGTETMSLPCGSDHMRLCTLHCPSPSCPSPSQHPLEVLPPQHFPARTAFKHSVCWMAQEAARAPLMPLPIPCLPRGGLRLWHPSDPPSALCLCSPKEAWR